MLDNETRNKRRKYESHLLGFISSYQEVLKMYGDLLDQAWLEHVCGGKITLPQHLKTVL